MRNIIGERKSYVITISFNSPFHKQIRDKYTAINGSQTHGIMMKFFLNSKDKQQKNQTSCQPPE